MRDHLYLLTQAALIHADRAPQYVMLRDYVEGRHRLDFASKKFREKHEWVLRSAQENLCPAIVNAHTNLLSIESWTADEDDESSALDDGLQRLATLVHNEAHTTGNAFTITWDRPGTVEPLAIFHKAEQVVPFVDDAQPDRLTAAVKLWVDPTTGYGRANVYDDTQLTRWVTRSRVNYVHQSGAADMTEAVRFPDRREAWEAYESEQAPSLESHRFRAVPVVWWKRNAPSQYEPGRSALTSALPVQDELNKLIADAVISSERIALPLRYIMDIAPELLQPKLNPATGRMEQPKLPFDESVNSILALSAKGPAGEFPGPAADQIIALQTHAEQKIARVTGIPVFYLSPTSGDVPSGEALRVLSSRLIAQVAAFQRDSGPAWKGQLELLGMRNPALKWGEPLPAGEGERLTNAAAAKDLGLPVDEWLRVAGMDPYAIDETGATLAERVQQAQQVRASDIGRAFMNGDLGASFGG